MPRSDPELMPGAPWRPPRWSAPVTMLLALAGVGAAAYLTVAHYSTGTQLACPETGVVNCAKVTTSDQSMIVGVPVALLGLLFFVGMLVLCLPPLWGSRARPVRLLRLAGAVAGVLMVLWLIFVELFLVEAICLWCTAVHAIALALFVAVALATATGSSSAALPDDEPDDVDDAARDDPAEGQPGVAADGIRTGSLRER